MGVLSSAWKPLLFTLAGLALALWWWLGSGDTSVAPEATDRTTPIPSGHLPATESAHALSTPNAPDATFATGLEEVSSVIVRFANDASRIAFLRVWEKQFPGSSRSFHPLGATRLNLSSPAARQFLREHFPPDAEWLFNPVMTRPVNPDFEAIPETAYQSFAEGIRAWLEIPEEVTQWGRGVMVAVLDTGLTSHTWPSLDLVERPLATNGPTHGQVVSLLLAGSDGLAPAADLLTVRVLDEAGRGDVFTVAEGIIRAVDQGARILNLSLGGPEDHPLLREAVDYATRRGAVLIAAAGNEGRDGLSFPAAYPEVLAVGAIDADRQHAHFSNRGQVALTAPGVGVGIPLDSETRALMSGTSAATPIVTGAVAALVSQFPGMTPAEAVRVLTANADDAGPAGPDDRWGAGVLNLDRALHHHLPGRHDPAIADLYLHPEPDPEGRFRLEVAVQNRGTSWTDNLRLRIQVGGDPVLTPRQTLALEAGESTGFSLYLDPARLQSEEGLTVRAMVDHPTLEDLRPGNNQKTAVFTLDPAE